MLFAHATMSLDDIRSTQRCFFSKHNSKKYGILAFIFGIMAPESSKNVKKVEFWSLYVPKMNAKIPCFFELWFEKKHL